MSLNYEDSIWVSDKLYFTGTFNVFFGRRDCTERLFRGGKTPSGELVKVPVNARPAPKYPRRAQRMGVQGFVIFAFDVNEQGEMVDLRVTESKPSLVFDKAATQAIKKLRFQPPKLDGEAVYVSDITMRMPFRLE